MKSIDENEIEYQYTIVYPKKINGYRRYTKMSLKVFNVTIQYD